MPSDTNPPPKQPCRQRPITTLEAFKLLLAAWPQMIICPNLPQVCHINTIITLLPNVSLNPNFETCLAIMILHQKSPGGQCERAELSATECYAFKQFIDTSVCTDFSARTFLFFGAKHNTSEDRQLTLIILHICLSSEVTFSICPHCGPVAINGWRVLDKPSSVCAEWKLSSCPWSSMFFFKSVEAW